MKLVLLSPVLFIAILFSSCTKQAQTVQPNQTILEKLDPGNWKYDASSNTYYNEISVPEIDADVVQNDAVLAYMTYNNSVYEILPDVLDGSTYVCFYQNGVFDVEIQNADGSLPSPPTGSIGIKIVIVKSHIN